jgi:hypothetical protein
MHKF